MERIVFLHPNFNFGDEGIFNRVWPPLSLAVSAAMLEEDGLDVRIVDAHALDLTPSEAVAQVGEADMLFITTSSLDKWQCPHFNLKFIEDFVREFRQNSKAMIIVEGIHGTVEPMWVFEHIAPDYLIRAEPEEVVRKICNGTKPETTKGVSYLKDGKLVENPLPTPPDLDKFPMPAFHLLPMEKYYYEVMGGKFTLLEGARGCPFKCIFCLQKMYYGYRTKSAENLLREIDYAVTEFGVKNIYFIDLEFTVNRKLAETVCNHLIEKKYKLRWCCQTRADSVDEKLLALMKRAGCALIHYGVETGSPEIMKLINKNITLEKIYSGVKMTHKAGIETACFFMFGFPGETEDQMRKTVEFALKLNPTYASFHSAAPYPGTKLGDMAGGGFKTHLPEHDFEVLRGMVKKAFLKFYLRPAYIISRARRGSPASWMRQLRLFTRYITKTLI
ncbi:MAG TPA: radical SAM protein [Candidatus Altiarchaeales archaeon]|nr:radical SAM protein [Candidatus Altiarchaeales archaeon]